MSVNRGHSSYKATFSLQKGARRDHMVVGFTTTCAISAFCLQSYEFEPRSWQGVLDATLCDKVCQWFVTGRWFSAVTPVSSTNKTNRHDITEILLKVALNTINKTKPIRKGVNVVIIFSSPCQRQCELLPSLGVRRLSSVNFSHFNLLLWNPSAIWTETW